MQKKQARKLTLTKETLRRLETGDLKRVEGGATIIGSCNETACQTCHDACTTNGC